MSYEYNNSSEYGEDRIVNPPERKEPPKKDKKSTIIVFILSIAVIITGSIVIGYTLGGSKKDVINTTTAAITSESKPKETVYVIVPSSEQTTQAQPSYTVPYAQIKEYYYPAQEDYIWAEIKLKTDKGSGNTLNIRSGPGYDYEVTAEIPNGATVQILEETTNWTHIIYNGVEGWCNTDVSGIYR